MVELNNDKKRAKKNDDHFLIILLKLKTAADNITFIESPVILL